MRAGRAVIILSGTENFGMFSSSLLLLLLLGKSKWKEKDNKRENGPQLDATSPVRVFDVARDTIYSKGAAAAAAAATTTITTIATTGSVCVYIHKESWS